MKNIGTEFLYFSCIVILIEVLAALYLRFSLSFLNY